MFFGHRFFIIVPWVLFLWHIFSPYNDIHSSSLFLFRPIPVTVSSSLLLLRHFSSLFRRNLILSQPHRRYLFVSNFSAPFLHRCFTDSGFFDFFVPIFQLPALSCFPPRRRSSAFDFWAHLHSFQIFVAILCQHICLSIFPHHLWLHWLYCRFLDPDSSSRFSFGGYLLSTSKRKLKLKVLSNLCSPVLLQLLFSPSPGQFRLLILITRFPRQFSLKFPDRHFLPSFFVTIHRHHFLIATFAKFSRLYTSAPTFDRLFSKPLLVDISGVCFSYLFPSTILNLHFPSPFCVATVPRNFPIPFVSLFLYPHLRSPSPVVAFFYRFSSQFLAAFSGRVFLSTFLVAILSLLQIGFSQAHFSCHLLSKILVPISCLQFFITAPRLY